MKLIKPAEISSKIMTLIEEADESLIIVSPYNDLENWDKIIKRFDSAIKRGIKISYYARKGANHKGLNNLRIKPVLIKDLHAKIYMNEKYAIVSSMNLVRYSDVQSLDIGYIVSEENELADLRDYINRYIAIQPIKSSNNSPTSNLVSKLPEYIKKEIILIEFYSRNFYGVNIFNKLMSFTKEYFDDSTFIKTCGFTQFKRKIGPWISFNEYGVTTRIDYFERGKLIVTEITKFNHRISLYDLVFSLVNIIGALYTKSITNLYFNEDIHIYIKEDKKKFYDYIEDYFQFKFDSHEHKNLGEIANELKTFIKAK